MGVSAMKKFPRKYQYGAGILVILLGLMIGCILYTTHKNTMAKVIGVISADIGSHDSS